MAVLEVARFSTLPEAELAVTLLRDHGINAYLPDREMANSMPHLQIAIGDIRVAAPDDQVARAREILAEASSGAFADDSDDGEWSRGAQHDGKVGELEAHQITGVLSSSRNAGAAVVVTLLVLGLAGALFSLA